MEMKHLTDDFATAPQITTGDLPAIRATGIRGLICTRPDAEAEGQPTFAQIRDAAEALGLTARHVPAVPGQIGPAEVSAFAAALSDLDGPVLAYCRSGARAETLWRAAQAPAD